MIQKWWNFLLHTSIKFPVVGLRQSSTQIQEVLIYKWRIICLVKNNNILLVNFSAKRYPIKQLAPVHIQLSTLARQTQLPKLIQLRRD